MNNRQRVKAIMNYESYDRLPLVHFGYWRETLDKWASEGHLKKEDYEGYNEGNEVDRALSEKVGFDFNWQTMIYADGNVNPGFEQKILEEFPDGTQKVLDYNGLITLQKPGINSIPAEVGYTLQNRKSWEECYLPKLQYFDGRVDSDALIKLKQNPDRDYPLGINCWSLFGGIRNWMGVQGISYLYADDEELYDEIIQTVADLNFKVIEKMLSIYSDFDFAHFWEDLCYKNGPLVNPRVFEEKVGPNYRRITDLVKSYGIDIISVDSDGKIDDLIPAWLNNGVNTVFPIEVGTWEPDFALWRKKYGKKLRGVGGMDKKFFGFDYAAIDAEIERLRPLVELGGYIPCPDHRIAPDAKWENVQYYCDRMREIFS